MILPFICSKAKFFSIHLETDTEAQIRMLLITMKNHWIEHPNIMQKAIKIWVRQSKEFKWLSTWIAQYFKLKILNVEIWRKKQFSFHQFIFVQKIHEIWDLRFDASESLKRSFDIYNSQSKDENFQKRLCWAHVV